MSFEACTYLLCSSIEISPVASHQVAGEYRVKKNEEGGIASRFRYQPRRSRKFIVTDRTSSFIGAKRALRQLCYFSGDVVSNFPSRRQLPLKQFALPISKEFYCRCGGGERRCASLRGPFPSRVNLPMVLPPFLLDIGQTGSQFSHSRQLKSDNRTVAPAPKTRVLSLRAAPLVLNRAEEEAMREREITR